MGGNTGESCTRTEPIVQSLMLTPQTAVRVPHLPNAVTATKELTVRTDFQLTKVQWREEQGTDLSLSKIVNLIRTKKLASYECQKADPDDLKGLLRQRKDLFLDNGLLYRKAYFKTTNKLIHQFVMPVKFCKRTVMVCHDDYGHLGMDRVLVLLQEQIFLAKNVGRCSNLYQTV